MQVNQTNAFNSIPSGYESAKRNAQAIGARLVDYVETEDMAIATVVSKKSPSIPKTLQELEEYIQGKYGANTTNKTIEGIPASINVSPAFLQKVLDDPEKMQWLEENLEAMQSLNTSMFAGTLTYVGYNVDGDGNIVMMVSSSSDPDGSIARANAKRKQEEAREKERLEQKRIEEKKEEEKRLEKLREKDEASGEIRVTISGESAKAVQAGLASALQSGIALDMKA